MSRENIFQELKNKHLENKSVHFNFLNDKNPSSKDLFFLLKIISIIGRLVVKNIGGNFESSTSNISLKPYNLVSTRVIID